MHQMSRDLTFLLLNSRFHCISYSCSLFLYDLCRTFTTDLDLLHQVSFIKLLTYFDQKSKFQFVRFQIDPPNCLLQLIQQQVSQLCCWFITQSIIGVITKGKSINFNNNSSNQLADRACAEFVSSALHILVMCSELYQLNCICSLLSLHILLTSQFS